MEILTKESLFYPFIEKPFNEDHLKTDGHEVYFSEYGNPQGSPIFFTHGGPGASCGLHDHRFFNPDKWRVIMIDQRGCGKSKPSGMLEANNTWALCSDIYEIRKQLGFNKITLFGGSWGSTLALIYTILFPRTVSGMVLRGIYLGTKRETDYFYKDGYDGIGIQIPEHWERYISHVPPEHRHDPLGYYYQEIKLGNKELARELALYECANLHLVPPGQEELEKDLDISPEIALIEAHYFTRNCFMDDGFILKNAYGITTDIPVTIVHGMYDYICMPESAYRLHKALPQSVLRWTLAGHSSQDISTLSVLIEETDKMFDEIRS